MLQNKSTSVICLEKRICVPYFVAQVNCKLVPKKLKQFGLLTFSTKTQTPNRFKATLIKGVCPEYLRMFWVVDLLFI